MTDPTTTEWVSFPTAAALLRWSHSRFYQRALSGAGGLEARKVGHRWYVTAVEAAS